MNNKVKKILYIIVAICLAINMKVISKIVINNRFIANYPEASQEYRLILLEVLNIYEPYIAYYNYGNYYYEKEKYENAYKKYLEALEYKIPNNRYCKVKINLSMSLVAQVDDENTEKGIKLLQEAKEHLNDCIQGKGNNDGDDQENGNSEGDGQNDGNGQDGMSEDQQKAQEMSDEISEQISEMESQKSQGSKEESNSDNIPEGPMPSDSAIEQLKQESQNASDNRDNKLEQDTYRDQNKTSNYEGCKNKCY